MSVFINQVGYLPSAKKIAVSTEESVSLFRADGSKVADYRGVYHEFDEASGDTVFHIDFSEIKEEGSYRFCTASGAQSALFFIRPHVYRDMKNSMLKALYLQRCGVALPKRFAGKFAHRICHTAPSRYYSSNRLAGDVCGGWHDAGDYGRYTTPGAVTVGHLLYAYELFPEAFAERLSIPESGNGVPDVLNECRFELAWLLKLQQPDGGVFHKLTSARHAPFVMPEDDTADFFLYPVSSMATGDFAAVMALAARIYRPYDAAFSEQMEAAAKAAFAWLLCHPEHVGFSNPADCGTGEYGDASDLDERFWAAAELARLAPCETYLAETERLAKLCRRKTSFGWSDVSGFASLAILFAEKGTFPAKLTASLRATFLKRANTLLTVIGASGYRMSLTKKMFCWGSNMSVMNHAIVLIVASLLTGNAAYEEAAAEQFHYLLGRNPLDVSYVTGFGERAYLRPHHRPIFADGIDEPIPGLVSGGPNGRPGDPKAIELLPAGTPPMKCFVDEYESYSTNEVTIYWNSPAIFVAAYFDRDETGTHLH